MSIQNILNFTGHVNGGYKKDAKSISKSFFDTMNDLDLEKKLVDPHMFDGVRVCRKAQKY